MDKRNYTGNARDSIYVLAEYNTLRDEIIHLNGLAFSIMQVSVLASLTVIGYFLQLESLDPILFPIPFFIIFPALFIIISLQQAIYRISGYIRVFLEKEGELGYENQYVKWLSEVSTSRKRIRLSVAKTLFYLYLGLGLLSIAVFVSKGVVPDFRCLTSTIAYSLLYFSPFPFYFYAARLIIRQDWRKIYDEYWRRVKEREKNGIAYNSG
jgi:hypothetical protein